MQPSVEHGLERRVLITDPPEKGPRGSLKRFFANALPRNLLETHFSYTCSLHAKFPERGPTAPVLPPHPSSIPFPRVSRNQDARLVPFSYPLYSLLFPAVPVLPWPPFSVPLFTAAAHRHINRERGGHNAWNEPNEREKGDFTIFRKGQRPPPTTPPLSVVHGPFNGGIM